MYDSVMSILFLDKLSYILWKYEKSIEEHDENASNKIKYFFLVIEVWRMAIKVTFMGRINNAP
jgi:hypothetical protein